MAPLVPVAIRSLSADGVVTIRGRVVEVYGDKFVLADATGRALVDAGPRADASLVTAGEPVTVQGRFDRGFVHAAFLVGPGGKVTALEPMGGPPHGPHDGPDRGPGVPPPPPPPGMVSPPAAAAPAATAAQPR